MGEQSSLFDMPPPTLAEPSPPPPAPRMVAGFPLPVPATRRARSADPRTSVEAARRAAKASLAALQAVEAAMADGVPRHDEAIWQACRSGGYVSSLDTIRHGRLALSESGVLVDTGETAVTSNGSRSVVWRKA